MIIRSHFRPGLPFAGEAGPDLFLGQDVTELSVVLDLMPGGSPSLRKHKNPTLQGRVLGARAVVCRMRVSNPKQTTDLCRLANPTRERRW